MNLSSRILLVMGLLGAATCMLGQDAASKLVSNKLVKAELESIAGDIASLSDTLSPDDDARQIGPHFWNLASLAFMAAHYDAEAAKHVFQAAVVTSFTKTQVGSPASSSGGTSLTQKPLLPALLGIAVENGAILEDVNQNTLTLSTSPYALIASVAGDTDTTYANYGGYTRLGATASFRITDTNSPLSNVGSKQLSNWGATFRFTKDVSARSPDAMKAFDATLRTVQQVAANASSSLHVALQNDPALVAARKQFVDHAFDAVKGKLASLKGKSKDDIYAAIEPTLESLFKQDVATTIIASKIRPEAEVIAYNNATKALFTKTEDFRTAVKN